MHPALALALTALLVGSSAFAGTFQCGDQRISVEQDGDVLRLTAGAETFVLRPVVAASGAKYQAADDSSTSFWSKGDKGLLELRGQTFPECIPVGAAPFSATGNEPFWRLDIGEDELTLTTDLGETRLTAPAPEPELAEGATHYVLEAAGRALKVTVRDELCTDSMTGMLHPSTVLLTLDGEELTGCGGDPASLLRGAEWQVEAIGGESPVEGSKASIVFSDEDRVSGSASCNRFTGGYTLTGEGLNFTQMATTMMACPDPIMAQEQRFLALLGEVSRFEIGDDGALVLLTGDGRSIEARRP